MTRTDRAVQGRNRRSGFILLALLAAIGGLLLSAPVKAQDDLDRAEAESRLQAIQSEIKRLQKQLEGSRTDQQKEQARLRELDLDIQRVNLDYRALEKRYQAHLDELARLELRRDEFLSRLAQRQDHLAEQIRASYRLGRQSRLKLLLNQDSPEQLSRMLAYYDYINRAQADKISGLKDALTTLDTMQQSIDLELLRMDDIKQEQRGVMDQLQQRRQNRQELLAVLAGQIMGEESALQELERDRQDLETLIIRLTNVLADIPADLGQHLGVASQKGRVPMPADGPVRHAFGQARKGGLHWQGWLIGVDAGTEVNAVAYGRVAFADWLRGYGLLIIIDHGEGFMSLYGHNESLLYEAGDWVEPGQAISVVGVAAGSNQGLYFELRKNGKAIDPAVWLAR